MTQRNLISEKWECLSVGTVCIIRSAQLPVLSSYCPPLGLCPGKWQAEWGRECHHVQVITPHGQLIQGGVSECSLTFLAQLDVPISLS